MKMTIRSFLISTIALCSFASATNTAFADCSSDDQSALLSCASNSVLSCRNLFPSCTEPGQVATIQDTLDAVGDKCCAITGKKKAARQTACFKVEEAKLAAMLKISTKTLKGFVRKTKAAVGNLRKDGCSTGSQS